MSSSRCGFCRPRRRLCPLRLDWAPSDHLWKPTDTQVYTPNHRPHTRLKRRGLPRSDKKIQPAQDWRPGHSPAPLSPGGPGAGRNWEPNGLPCACCGYLAEGPDLGAAWVSRDVEAPGSEAEETSEVALQRPPRLALLPSEDARPKRDEVSSELD